MSDDEREVIDVSDSADDTSPYDFFSPLVKRVVSALGGGTPYVPGDSAYACLKDLKRLWRKDDDTVARLLWETRVMITDLIPMLLVLTPEDKRAVATVDLITAMTWPIDVAAELKELDDSEEDADARPEYTHLLAAHAAYKTALCAPDVLDAVFRILLPPLARPTKERTPRDGQIINVILHLYRNLAFIKSDSSPYIIRLRDTHAADLLLTVAANTSHDPLFNSFNTVVLETLYLLTRFVPPAAAPTTKTSLANLLEEDAKLKKKHVASRHSRFGTTVQVTLKHTAAKPFVLHRGQAVDLKTSATDLWDIAKKPRARPPREVVAEERLSLPAAEALRALMNDFIDGAFNDFTKDIIKDIRAERPKITESDNLRLLCLSSWVLEFFLSRAEKELGLVAEVAERTWIAWVLRRIREAMDDKPKRLSEIKAGVGVLTQLILVIENLEGRDTFIRQLVYNGETLDIAYDSLKLRIDGSVRMVHELLRVLEGSERMIRKKKGGEGEINWSFEAFESRFATPEITAALLAHLATVPTPLKYVIALMHRQVVRLKAEGLYFNVSTLLLFQRLLREQPKEKDLVKFINFVLRQFFKTMEVHPFLAIEALFPRTKGDWKKFSSWEPPKKERRAKKEKMTVEKELHVKDGYEWKEQLGIALKALGQQDEKWTEWVKQLLTAAVAQRHRELEVPDEDEDDASEVEGAERKDKPERTATDFMVPMVDDDYVNAAAKNPYLRLVFRLCGFKIWEEGDDEDGEVTWILPKEVDVEKKLAVVDEYLKTPIDIEDALITKTKRRRRVVAESSSSSDDDSEDYAGGRSGGEGNGEERIRRKREKREKKEKKRSKRKAEGEAKRQRKEKEQVQYKSAQFIEDSDEEYGDMEEFLKKEAEKRAGKKVPVKLYEERPEGMRAHGTKKRKKRNTENNTEKGSKRKKRKGADEGDTTPPVAVVDSDADDEDIGPVIEKPSRPRPRPKPAYKPAPEPVEEPSNELPEDEDMDVKMVSRKPKRLVLSDDDED